VKKLPQAKQFSLRDKMNTKIPWSKSFIANTVTSLNVFCGFLSIVFASEAEFRLAAILIIAAAIFDTLDGITARLLHTSSRFGVELDSLSDVVSFGAAPAFLIYKAYAYQFGIWGILLSSSLLVFGALRLARFNIQVEDLDTKGDFKGLPIPLQAMTISLLVYSFYQDGKIIEPYNYFVIALIVLLSFLMVSKIRYNALPKLKNKNMKEKVFLFGILMLALILAIVTNGAIVFFILLGIIFFGIIRWFVMLIFKKKDSLENGLKISEN
jgi:CDP-diacylglycerol---serine O-phosphatidyltransferase